MFPYPVSKHGVGQISKSCGRSGVDVGMEPNFDLIWFTFVNHTICAKDMGARSGPDYSLSCLSA